MLYKKLLIICIIIVIFISLGITFYLFNRNKNNDTNQMEINSNSTIDERIKIGQRYNCITAGYEGYLVFNNTDEFELKVGLISMNDDTTMRGTYTIQEDTTVLHVTYNSLYLVNDTNEMNSTFSEYNETVEILEDDILNFVTIDNITFTFQLESVTNTTNNNNLSNGESAIIDNVEKIDRKTFVNKLTEENKQDIKQYILTSNELNDNKNFVEDRFGTEGEEIIYTYVDVQGENLNATIYVITPAEEIPVNLHEYADQLYNYFVVKSISTFVHLSKSEGISDSEIENAIEELNLKIEKEIDYFKEFIPLNDQLKSICYGYSKYIDKYYSYIPSGMEYENDNYAKTYEMYPPDEGLNETHSWRKSGYYCSDGSEYYQILDNRHILRVQYLRKYIKAESYKENSSVELVAYGVYLDLSNLPLLFSQFEAEELVLTGYLPKDIEEAFVITPVTTVTSEEYNNTEKQKVFYDEQNKYIRSYFGL